MLDCALAANKVMDEARKMKKECLIFKVDFEKPMTLCHGLFYSTCIILWAFAINGSRG